MIKGLHHNAYRCRDSEETRKFYEDFLGLPLADAFEIKVTKTGRETSVLHSFYRLGDGSFLAFFEAPAQPFEFKDQHDFDLHIALETDRATPRVSMPAALPLAKRVSWVASSVSSAMCRSKSCWSLNSKGCAGASKKARKEPSPRR